MTTTAKPTTRALQPMGEGKWAGIVHAATGAPRYGHIACMGCAAETQANAYVADDGNWYCGIKGADETCEAYTRDVRRRLGMEDTVIR